jgi:tripartite-type tricarboxylate transporter receptor subunit TctC
MAKTDLVLVPYTGDAPVINALLGGQVDMGLTTLFAARPHVESGRLKVLASTGGRRSGALPQVPTVAEAANLPGYQGINFIGLLLPTGTPVDIIRKINEHLVAFLKTDEFKNLFPTDDIVASTPAEFEAFLREVNERNARLIQATGIKDSN